MGKNILIILCGFLFILIIVFGVTMCGVMQIADEALKEREPQLRQYIQMTPEEQNIYIENNINELFTFISSEIKPNNQEIDIEILEKIQNDSNIHEAGINLGRSIVATFIISSDNIVKDLNSDEKLKFKEESDKIDKRIKIYTTLLEKYDNKNRK